MKTQSLYFKLQKKSKRTEYGFLKATTILNIALSIPIQQNNTNVIKKLL